MKNVLAVFAFTVATLFGMAAPSMADTVSPGVHLDLTSGFTSIHGSYKQFDGVFNYGTNLTLGLNKHVELFGNVGGNTAYQVTPLSARRLNATGVYNVFVYGGGVKFVLSPNAKVSVGYSQSLDPTFLTTPNFLREVNVQGTLRVF